MGREQGLELPAEIQIDPNEQDRRHVRKVTRRRLPDAAPRGLPRVAEFVTVARIVTFSPGRSRRCERPTSRSRWPGSATTSTRCRTLPHLKGPLGEGRLEDCVLSCPWHGWQYDVRTGKNEFDLAIRITTYDVLAEDGEVKVPSDPVADGLERGLELIRRGSTSRRTKNSEDAWQAQSARTRLLPEGLVHVTGGLVSGRPRQPGSAASANSRKPGGGWTPYAASHRGAHIWPPAAIDDAASRVAAGSLELPPRGPDAETERAQQPVEADPQPPEAAEEEQQAERVTRSAPPTMLSSSGRGASETAPSRG